MPDISDLYNRAQKEMYDEYNEWADSQGYEGLSVDGGPFVNPFSTMAAGQPGFPESDLRTRMMHRYAPPPSRPLSDILPPMPTGGTQSNPMSNMILRMMMGAGGGAGSGVGQPGGGYGMMNKNQAKLLNILDMEQ